jgi:hypothetical protein
MVSLPVAAIAVVRTTIGRLMLQLNQKQALQNNTPSHTTAILITSFYYFVKIRI